MDKEIIKYVENNRRWWLGEKGGGGKRLSQFYTEGDTAIHLCKNNGLRVSKIKAKKWGKGECPLREPKILRNQFSDYRRRYLSSDLDSSLSKLRTNTL